MFLMIKSSSPARADLEKRFNRLRQKLAHTGYISRGSVLARSPVTSGRSGYQWTRKVAGKTVSLALSQEQFEAMKRAVLNERQLRRTIEQMEKISRQIIFQMTTDTRRRKHLRKKVLGTI